MKTKLAGRRSLAELRLGAAGLVVLLATGAVVALPPTVAQAATDVVTNCSGSSSVPGSLPYEVATSGSGDTITFALSPPCPTITPASTIASFHNLTIAGPGADDLTVSGGGTQEVFFFGGGTVTISGLTIDNGNAGGGDGGGIDNQATLTVADSTLSNDTADFGGGIENSGTLTVSGSTFSNDTAAHSGGGIESDSAAMTVTNTTFSKDSTGTGEGGGVDMFDGTATITNSTFSADSAPSYFGGGIEDDQGDLSMGATIVANSPSGNDCFLQLPIGTFTDLGNNLDDDGTCHLTLGSDLPSTPAGLDPSGLQNNGGPTQTVALAAGSAAIDHISNAPQCPATDQRGSPRNVPCDIGAYDTDGSPAVVSEVSPSAGSTAGGDTVTITGSGFTGATAVDFGGTPATIDAATGDTVLTVTDPAGSAGTADVTVTAPGGVSSVSSADQYTYTVVQTIPNTAPCTPTCTTNTVSSPLNNTSVSVDGSSGNSNPDATTNLLINTTKLNCGSSKAHNYDYLTAVSTLSTTDFATGQVLTVTENLGSEPSTKGVKVCYAASSTATSGTFLKKCKPSMVAPCLKALKEVSGNVVATLLVPATDPRFWAGDGALDVTSFSPSKGPPGTTVTIKGKNLSQIRSVVIGGAQAPISTQSTATKVVVTVPSSAAVKAGVITVTGASGEAVSAKLFTVN
ncbi:MAG TPA: IPT/TIG domain-containing protein [Acidimicrobiales bacterium]|jgi:predicted outer membrane repeat protein